MTIRLKLQDGTVKEYPLRGGGSGEGMKCGAPDCDHLECAIEDRISGSRGLKMVIMFLPVGTLFTLAIIYFALLQPSTVLLAFAVAGAVMVLDFVCIFLLARIARGLDEQVRELQEFREKKTVNGIPAEQVHGDPGSG